MKLKTRITVAVVAGAALAGVAAAGTATASTTPTPSTAAKTALVSSTGKTIAAPKPSSATSIVHNGFVPASQKRSVQKRTVSPHSIIGADDNRYLVTNTTSFPNSAVVLIKRNGNLHCTGWMISKDTLLSAGHCVTDGHGTWYSGLTFSPGSNGGNAPYGTCASRGTYAFNAWINGADSNYDTSIIKLNCTVGNSTGWFGTWWQSASLNGTSARISGYPGDKPSTQWVSYDYIRNSSTDRLYYQNDTAGGNSGSPVYQYRYNQPYCNGYCAMGVHTNGSDGTNNSGVRFTQGKLNSIYAIVNQP